MTSGVMLSALDVAKARAGEGDEVCGSYDWIVDFENIQQFMLPEFLEVGYDSRMLMVGCGTSKLSEKLYDAGFHRIVNVDIDGEQIEAMKQSHEDKGDMTWLECDICRARDIFPDDECFDIAVDKGTLDALLCCDAGSEMMCEVFRLLRPGGVHLIISFRARPFLERLLDVSEFGYALTVHPIPTTPAQHQLEHHPAQQPSQAHLYLLRKPSTAPKAADGAELLSAVKSYQDGVIECWHREGDPLLTAEREGTIRRLFARRLAAAALPETGRLGVDECYEILFTEEERGDYGYEFAAFQEDLAAFAEGRGGFGGGGGGGAPERLSCEEALAFLSESQ